MFGNFLKHYIYIYIYNYIYIISNNTFAEVGECQTCLFRCGLCCKNLCKRDLNRLRRQIDSIKITKEDINKKNCSYSYSNFNFINKFKKLEGSGRFIKAEDSINLNEWFVEYNKFLGNSYPGKDKFNDSFDLFCSYFTSRMTAKVQYNLPAGDVDKYIVIEGTIKIPDNITEEEFKKQYFETEYELMMYNMIKNCMSNNYGFSYYLDNLDIFKNYNLESPYEEYKKNQETKPRNEKIDELVTKENLSTIFDSKIKGKDLIIIYKYCDKGKVSIFTKKEN